MQALVCMLQGDIPASQMINSLPGVNPARRAKVMQVLDIDPEWRMHRVSDGQRRRVQICMGLLKPPEVHNPSQLCACKSLTPQAGLTEQSGAMWSRRRSLADAVSKESRSGEIASIACRFFSWMRSQWTWMCWQGQTS